MRAASDRCAALPCRLRSPRGDVTVRLTGGRSSSHTSSAFWACSRFSASSHTALCGPSMTSSVISSPAVRRQAVQHDGFRIGQFASRSALIWNGRNGPHPVESVVLLAHRRPGVGHQHVGAVGRRPRIGGDGHGRAGLGGPRAAPPSTNRGCGLETGWRGDGHVDARGHAAEHQRVRHVVGAVAEVGQPQPRQRALALGERLQVGEHLARVELVGQRVDDRHRRTGCHRGQPFLGERPPHDGVDVARQHPAGVLQRLLAAELGAAAVDDDGVPAELRDAHLEREPGAGRVLLEDHGDAARALQRARG